MSRRTIAVAFLLGLLAWGGYTLNILFSDGMSFPRESYGFWVAISSEAIASFPVLEPVGVPVYHYSSADGPGPATQGISYSSALGEAELERRITAFLLDQGFRRDGAFFAREGDSLSVRYLETPGSVTRVTATLASQ